MDATQTAAGKRAPPPVRRPARSHFEGRQVGLVCPPPSLRKAGRARRGPDKGTLVRATSSRRVETAVAETSLSLFVAGRSSAKASRRIRESETSPGNGRAARSHGPGRGVGDGGKEKGRF